MLFILDLEKGFLGLFEFFCRSRGETEVPIEIIVIDEVWPDRFKINQNIIKLLKNKEALGHALSSWNSVALGWRGTNHLEEVLGNSQMFFLLSVLSNNCVNNCFKDIFFWHNTFHVLNQVIGIIGLIVL